MIVILAVALIVVGPDKLPDMARSVAKWVFELKKTMNQVKESLADEDSLLGSVQSDLRKTGDDLKGKLLEADDFTWREPGGPIHVPGEKQEDVIDMNPLPAGPLGKGEVPGADADSRDTGAAEKEFAAESETPPAKPSP